MVYGMHLSIAMQVTDWVHLLVLWISVASLTVVHQYLEIETAVTFQDEYQQHV